MEARAEQRAAPKLAWHWAFVYCVAVVVRQHVGKKSSKFSAISQPPSFKSMQSEPRPPVGLNWNERSDWFLQWTVSFPYRREYSSTCNNLQCAMIAS